MAHPRARLNVLGRELLVSRVIVLGWSATTAADAQGVSRATAYKWVRRFRAEGTYGGGGLLGPAELRCATTGSSLTLSLTVDGAVVADQIVVRSGVDPSWSNPICLAAHE